MRRALALLAIAATGCAGAPPLDAASAAPVATVVLAPPQPASPAPSTIADAASPDAPADAASVDSGGVTVTRPRSASAGCDAVSMDLPTLQRRCACPVEITSLNMGGAAGARCRPLESDEQQRILRDVTVQVGAPASMPAGGRVELTVSVRNGGAEPVPLVLINDESPEIILSDALGRRIAATIDPSCQPTGSMRMPPVSLGVVPSGGVVHATVPFQAVRWRSVGPTWRSGGKAPAGHKHSTVDEMVALAALSDPTCRDVADGPLPRGDYSVEVRLPFMPQDLASKVVGRASIRVR